MKLRRVILLLVVIVLVVGLVIPLGEIALRLHLNGRVARSVVDGLQEKYPTARCSAIVSYQRSVIYLRISGISEPARKVEIETWVARFKAEHALAVEFWLRWMDMPNADDESTIVKL